MIDFIVVAVLVVIVAAAAFYVYKAKKSGKKCIGCPDGCSCGSKKDSSHCSCGKGHNCYVKEKVAAFLLESRNLFLHVCYDSRCLVKR